MRHPGLGFYDDSPRGEDMLHLKEYQKAERQDNKDALRIWTVRTPHLGFVHDKRQLEMVIMQRRCL